MKILMPSNDEKTISRHFGRAKGFLIFVVEDGKIQNKDYIPNTITGHGRGMHNSGSHNHGSHAGIIKAIKDVQVVISCGMGKRMYDELKHAGKEVYVTDITDPEEAVKLYLNGKLENFEALLD